VQVDFSTPGRLDASYIAEDGSKQIPVMIHRAILGSFERFMGILIEHYAGKLPLWLSPVQAAVLTISEKQNEYGEKVRQILQKRGIRTHFDLRNEKIGFKIREHTLQKVPYLLIIGDKEVEKNLVAVRTQAGKDLGVMTIETIYDDRKTDRQDV
jgi:threonyl-tRNA synthetase